MTNTWPLPLAVGASDWGTIFNVGKGTNFFNSNQIGRRQGVGREVVGFNSLFFYKVVGSWSQTFMNI